MIKECRSPSIVFLDYLVPDLRTSICIRWVIITTRIARLAYYHIIWASFLQFLPAPIASWSIDDIQCLENIEYSLSPNPRVLSHSPLLLWFLWGFNSTHLFWSCNNTRNAIEYTKNWSLNHKIYHKLCACTPPLSIQISDGAHLIAIPHRSHKIHTIDLLTFLLLLLSYTDHVKATTRQQVSIYDTTSSVQKHGYLFHWNPISDTIHSEKNVLS